MKILHSLSIGEKLLFIISMLTCLISTFLLLSGTSFYTPPPIASLDLPTIFDAPLKSHDHISAPESVESGKIYLHYPAAQATFTHSFLGDDKSYSLKLRFEVEPKNLPCSIEIYHHDEVIFSQNLSISQTGMYEISVAIKKTGEYQWRVFTPYKKSELRTFSVHE